MNEAHEFLKKYSRQEINSHSTNTPTFHQKCDLKDNSLWLIGYPQDVVLIGTKTECVKHMGENIINDDQPRYLIWRVDRKFYLTKGRN